MNKYLLFLGMISITHVFSPDQKNQVDYKKQYETGIANYKRATNAYEKVNALDQQRDALSKMMLQETDPLSQKFTDMNTTMDKIDKERNELKYTKEYEKFEKKAQEDADAQGDPLGKAGVVCDKCASISCTMM